MSRQYRELVGLQVVFSKTDATYRLVHFYRLVQPEQKRGPVSLEGYDMQRDGTIKDITNALRSAYAPAVLSIWIQDAEASASELLQFEANSRPDDLGLRGEWSVWAET